MDNGSPISRRFKPKQQNQAAKGAAAWTIRNHRVCGSLRWPNSANEACRTGASRFSVALRGS